ncbi:MAG TPA: alpha/beta hydrolase [Acidimicrobiales bacterium]
MAVTVAVLVAVATVAALVSVSDGEVLDTVAPPTARETPPQQEDPPETTEAQAPRDTRAAGRVLGKIVGLIAPKPASSVPGAEGSTAQPSTTGSPAGAPAAPAPRTAPGQPPTGPAPTDPPAPPPPPPPPPASGVRCLVRLHGKGGGPSGTEQLAADLLELEPGGNAAGWGGRQWLYYPESGYAAARAIVQRAIDEAGCGPVLLYGFSNGGAFAAKLYCRGETFGGRVIGVIIDDPVVDHAVEGCSPAGGVRVVLYWTGGLEPQSQPGWDCVSADWTCEGGSTIGIDAYQAALGVTRMQSPHASHAPNWFPAELDSWW